MIANDYIFGKRDVATVSDWNVYVNEITGTAFRVNWDAVENATDYDLYLDGVLYESGIQNRLFTYVTGLNVNTLYNVQMVANNGTTEIKQSDVISVTTLASVLTSAKPDGMVERWRMDEATGEMILKGSIRGFDAGFNNDMQINSQPAIVGTGVQRSFDSDAFMIENMIDEINVFDKDGKEAPFAISVWVNFQNNLANYDKWIFSNRVNNDTDFQLYVTNNGEAIFHISSNGTITDGNYLKTGSTTRDMFLADGWNHLAVVNYPGENKIFMMVNGKFKWAGFTGVNYDPNNPSKTVRNVCVQSWDPDTGSNRNHAVEGIMDDFIFWKYDIPTISDLSDVYNGGSGNDIADPTVTVGGIVDLRMKNIVSDAVWLECLRPSSLDGLSHYEIFIDGTYYADSEIGYFFARGLTPGTTYNIQARGVDINGVKGALSNTIQVTTTSNFVSLDNLSFYDVNDVHCHYKFNGNVNDSSSNGYHGTPTDVTFDQLGGLPTAKFNGASSFIQLPDPAGYNESQTIMYWQKKEGVGWRTYTKGSDKDGGWGIQVTGGIHNIGMSLVTTSPTAGWSVSDPAGKEKKTQEENFNHVALVWDDATDTAKIYLDGVLIASNTRSGTTLRGNKAVYIGAGRPGNTTVLDGFLDGELADFAIIKRALTDAEILEASQQ